MGSNDPLESQNGYFYYLVYTEAFKRMGLEMEYRFLPAKRASIESQAGRIDGELARIYSYNENRPNLIRVAQPTKSDRFCAFSINDSIHLNGWESLDSTKYRVEYLQGVIKVEFELKKYVSPQNLSYIISIQLGLRKLMSKRTDIYVDSESAINSFLNKKEFLNSDIKEVGVLEEVHFYSFLHKKHSKISHQLSDILSQMKKENQFDKFEKLAKEKY